MEEAEKLWTPSRLGRFEDFMVGPLACEDPARPSGPLVARRESYAAERGLLCWDRLSSCFARVVDWAKDEYWGERVLMVREVAPNGLGMRWERRQSALWEIGADWQSMAAQSALGRLDDASREAFCAHVKSWFAAEELAREISGRCEQGAAGSRPRL